MRINIKQKKENKATFFSLENGQVFMYNNIVFMKMEEVMGSRMNAIKLADGKQTNFNTGDIIEKIKAEINIELE